MAAGQEKALGKWLHSTVHQQSLIFNEPTTGQQADDAPSSSSRDAGPSLTIWEAGPMVPSATELLGVNVSKNNKRRVILPSFSSAYQKFLMKGSMKYKL